jgi:hypothetical protein
MEGIHRLPYETNRMTPAQVVAISKAAGKNKGGVQVTSQADYERWQRIYAEQNREDRILEAARAELNKERDGRT